MVCLLCFCYFDCNILRGGVDIISGIFRNILQDWGADSFTDGGGFSTIDVTRC